MISAASASKYWALWRVRRKRSKVGLANALISPANLGRDRILDRHMGSLSPGGAKTLTAQQRLRGHPVRVVGSHERTIGITTAEPC